MDVLWAYGLYCYVTGPSSLVWLFQEDNVPRSIRLDFQYFEHI